MRGTVIDNAIEPEDLQDDELEAVVGGDSVQYQANKKFVKKSDNQHVIR
jgi:hypothetical protein